MAITLPYTLQAKSLAVAAQVMANFNAVISAVEGIGTASTASDVYQAGVLTDADWKFTGLPAVTGSGTGVTTWNAVGGAAWLPGASGGLVRTFVASAVQPGQKPVLPLPGGFICCGLRLTASGSGALLSVASGTEQSSEAAALANPPVVGAGTIGVFDYVLKNVAGSYSTGTSVRDRRPWARGAYARAKIVSGTVALGTLAILSGTPLRIECSGVPLRLWFRGQLVGETAKILQAKMGFRIDEAAVDGTEDGFIYQATAAAVGEGVSGRQYAQFAYEFTPAAGSHLFNVVAGGTTASLIASAAQPVEFSVSELRSSANNGTS